MTPITLSPAEILAFVRAAGFPRIVDVTMVAIAMRESAGQPGAFNGNAKTGDKSYGLWQINMAGSLALPRMRAFGIATEDQLFDPATNARAAFVLFGGSVKNLSTAWYIDHPSRVGMFDYKAEYEKHLPAAQAAALGL